MGVAHSISDVDGGWDLGGETEQPLTTTEPRGASLATVEPEPAAQLDDGWCLSNDDDLAPAAEAEADGCRELEKPARSSAWSRSSLKTTAGCRPPTRSPCSS